MTTPFTRPAAPLRLDQTNSLVNDGTLLSFMYDMGTGFYQGMAPAPFGVGADIINVCCSSSLVNSAFPTASDSDVGGDVVEWPGSDWYGWGNGYHGVYQVVDNDPNTAELSPIQVATDMTVNSGGIFTYTAVHKVTGDNKCTSIGFIAGRPFIPDHTPDNSNSDGFTDSCTFGFFQNANSQNVSCYVLNSSTYDSVHNQFTGLENLQVGSNFDASDNAFHVYQLEVTQNGGSSGRYTADCKFFVDGSQVGSTLTGVTLPIVGANTVCSAKGTQQPETQMMLGGYWHSQAYTSTWNVCQGRPIMTLLHKRAWTGTEVTNFLANVWSVTATMSLEPTGQVFAKISNN